MFRRKKGTQSARERRQVLSRIDKKALRYVTQKEDGDTEIILGKSGAINIIGDEVVVDFEGADSLRFKADAVKVGELMSLEGFVLSGEERTTGRHMNIVGYYKYHR